MRHREEHSYIYLLLGTVHVATGSFRNITQTRQRLSFFFFLIKMELLFAKILVLLKTKKNFLETSIIKDTKKIM